MHAKKLAGALRAFFDGLVRARIGATPRLDLELRQGAR